MVPLAAASFTPRSDLTAMRSSEFDFTKVLRAGDVVAWPQGTGEPRGLTGRLVRQRHELPPVGLFVGMMTSKTLSAEHADRFTFRGLNGAGTNRHLTAAKVLIPPRPLLDLMTRTMSPLIDQIIANRTQSRTLATLRDTQLPKVLSGKIASATTS